MAFNQPSFSAEKDIVATDTAQLELLALASPEGQKPAREMSSAPLLPVEEKEKGWEQNCKVITLTTPPSRCVPTRWWGQRPPRWRRRWVPATRVQLPCSRPGADLVAQALLKLPPNPPTPFPCAGDVGFSRMCSGWALQYCWGWRWAFCCRRHTRCLSRSTAFRASLDG